MKSSTLKNCLKVILLMSMSGLFFSFSLGNCSPDACVAACSNTDNLLDENFDLGECLDGCYSDAQDCIDSDPCIAMIGEEYESCRRSQRLEECNQLNPNQEGYCTCVVDGGIKLNTNIPFIGRCIRLGNDNEPTDTGDGATTVSQLTAFPVLMSALTSILLSIILLVSLIMVIAGGVMIASSGANGDGYKNGKDMIRRVVVGLIILGASGIILAIINPNFFGKKYILQVFLR